MSTEWIAAREIFWVTENAPKFAGIVWAFEEIPQSSRQISLIVSVQEMEKIHRRASAGARGEFSLANADGEKQATQISTPQCHLEASPSHQPPPPRKFLPKTFAKGPTWQGRSPTPNKMAWMAWKWGFVYHIWFACNTLCLFSLIFKEFYVIQPLFMTCFGGISCKYGGLVRLPWFSYLGKAESFRGEGGLPPCRSNIPWYLAISIWST